MLRTVEKCNVNTIKLGTQAAPIGLVAAQIMGSVSMINTPRDLSLAGLKVELH